MPLNRTTGRQKVPRRMWPTKGPKDALLQTVNLQLATLTDKNLRALDLSGTQITDEAASTLMTLTKLEQLRLTNTSITDTGLGSIAKLRQLKSLAAPKSMGDQGLAALADLPMLEELFLTGSNVGDE